MCLVCSICGYLFPFVCFFFCSHQKFVFVFGYSVHFQHCCIAVSVTPFAVCKTKNKKQTKKYVYKCQAIHRLSQYSWLQIMQYFSSFEFDCFFFCVASASSSSFSLYVVIAPDAFFCCFFSSFLETVFISILVCSVLVFH